MTVMEVLLSKLVPGIVLTTPVLGREFVVESVSPSGGSSRASGCREVERHNG